MGPATSPTTPQPEGQDGATSGRDSSPALDPALPALGHLVAGKYRMDGVIGRGGMGVVTACHQVNLDRPVAVKFLRHTLTSVGRRRFTREAMAIAKLQNEHVVRVIDAGEENGVPFIVMERLVGNDLADELASGPIAPELAARYLSEACEGLAEAHVLGIVHRDLKPSNLFITKRPNGQACLKVLDFGVSKWLDAASDGAMPLSTADHGFVGTPAYVSPEQLTTPNAVDERSDVWSLGVVLHQCLSGERPFVARGVPQLCAAILTAQPAQLGPHVSERFSSVVRRCLRKNPADRYQSVHELSAALASLQNPRTGRQRVLDKLRPRWFAVIAAVAAGLLATLGAIAFSTKSRQTEAATAEGERTADKREPIAKLTSAGPSEPSRPTQMPATPTLATPPPAFSSTAARVSERRRPTSLRPTSSVDVPAPVASNALPPAVPAPQPSNSKSDAKPLYRR